MPIEQIIVLALIQGITEFLPISSSGHLILVPALTGWRDQGVVTDMVTNLGTFAAVIIYFWRDVVAMFWGTIDIARRKSSPSSRLTFHVIIGTVPIIIIGLLMASVGAGPAIEPIAAARAVCSAIRENFPARYSFVATPVSIRAAMCSTGC